MVVGVDLYELQVDKGLMEDDELKWKKKFSVPY
jgi:hypothetical protein